MIRTHSTEQETLITELCPFCKNPCEYNKMLITTEGRMCVKCAGDKKLMIISKTITVGDNNVPSRPN